MKYELIIICLVSAVLIGGCAQKQLSLNTTSNATINVTNSSIVSVNHTINITPNGTSSPANITQPSANPPSHPSNPPSQETPPQQPSPPQEPSSILSAGFSGGFVENVAQVRPRLTAEEISKFVPDSRGRFTFPLPYNTTGVRITVPEDCDGTDCVNYIGYSYWKNINNHSGSEMMYIFVSLRNHGGPTLFAYNKSSDNVTKVGPLFNSSTFASHSGEGWYFSASEPTKLYVWLPVDTKLYRYDILNKTFEQVLDLSSASFGAGKYIWQMHSSDDDKVHIGTVRDISDYSTLGCFVFREEEYTYYPALGDLDECNLDGSGRWMIMLDNVDGQQDVDNRVIDLETGTETIIYDQQGALGHLDMGNGYAVGADNWNVMANAITLAKFPLENASHVGTVVNYNKDWDTSVANHISHQNRQSGPAESQFACGSNLDYGPNENEIVCFPLDSSNRTLIVAPVMSNASGSGDFYSKMPKGNIDVTGQYFIWTSNLGSDRLDIFLVKVPSEKLFR